MKRVGSSASVLLEKPTDREGEFANYRKLVEQRFAQMLEEEKAKL